MYIFIDESGEPMVSTTCTDEDMAACDYGVLDAIDVSREIPLRYYNGSWDELESIDDD